VGGTDKEERRKKEKERRKRKRKRKKGVEKKGKKEKEWRKKKKMLSRAISTFYNLNPTGEAVLQNVLKNGNNSTREATPPAEPEPFFEEPEPCQIGP
jgi:hypothetical protein